MGFKRDWYIENAQYMLSQDASGTTGAKAGLAFSTRGGGLPPPPRPSVLDRFALTEERDGQVNE